MSTQQSHPFVVLLIVLYLIALVSIPRPEVAHGITASTAASALTGSLLVPRRAHTATRLLDGSVLVVGGVNNNAIYQSAERYDPASGLWSDAGSTILPRISHSAALMPDGTVIVVGGGGDTASLPRLVERYHPTSNSWSTMGSLNVGRMNATIVPQPDGSVIIIGGDAGSNGMIPGWSVERYSPLTTEWTIISQVTGALSLTPAVVLADGRALLIGSIVRPCPPDCTATPFAAIYDLVANQHMQVAPQQLHEHELAFLLADGIVMTAGGSLHSPNVGETYEPAYDLWRSTEPLNERRSSFAAIALADQNALVFGGIDAGTGIVSRGVELYQSRSRSWTLAQPMLIGRMDATVTLLTDGTVLIVGGMVRDAAYVLRETASVERYNAQDAVFRTHLTVVSR